MRSRQITRRTPLRAATTLALAVAIVALTIYRFPPSDDPPFQLSLLVIPTVAKTLSVLRSVALLVCLNLAALTLGRPLERRLRIGTDPRYSALVRLALGFILLANAVFALAVAQRLDPAWLAALVIVPAALGIRDTWTEICQLKRHAPRLRWSLALTVMVLAGGPVLAAFVPDYGWDAFVYHLAIPERYLFLNSVWFSRFSVQSAFPLLVQMLYALALSIDPGPLAKLLHAEFGLLTLATTALLARRTSRRAALFAVAILAADALFFWEMGVAYVDLAGCFFALLAAATAAETLHGENRRTLVLCGIFSGAALATQWRLAIVPVAVLLALSWPFPNLRRLRGLAIIAAVSVAVMLPWLGRNLIVTGNPVSPMLQGVFHLPGQEYFDPVAIEQAASITRIHGPGASLENFILLPWSLFFGTRPDGMASHSFQIGCLYLLALGACLLNGQATSPRQALYLRIAAVGTLLWFWSGAQESRYLLPILVLLAVPGAESLDAILPRQRVWTQALGAILLVAVLYGQWTSLRLLPWRWGYALGTLSVENFESQEPALEVAKQLHGTLSPNDRLLLVFEARSYFFRGLDYIPYSVSEGSPTLQMIHQARDARELHRTLRWLGVTHVLVNSRSPLTYRTRYVAGYDSHDFESDLAKLKALMLEHATPIIQNGGVVVAKLDPDPASGPGDETSRLD